MPDETAKTPTPIDPPKRRRGMPRNGRWPVRPPRSEVIPYDNKPWVQSDRWMPAFLKCLAQTGNVTASCDRAKVNRTNVYDRRATNKEFAAAWEDAVECYCDRVEEEVARRAIEGRETFVWDKEQKKLVSTGKVPDNLLLMFYMKKLRPQFKDSWKAEDQSGAAANTQVIVNFLKQFNATSDQQSEMPTFEAFMREQEPAALPAPASPPETAAEKRERLLRELAELDAEPHAHD